MQEHRKNFFERVFSNIGLEDDGIYNAGYNLLIETSDGNIFPYHVGTGNNRIKLFTGLIDGLDNLRAYVDWSDVVNYFREERGYFSVYLSGGTEIRIFRDSNIEEEVPLSLK